MNQTRAVNVTLKISEVVISPKVPIPKTYHSLGAARAAEPNETDTT